MSILIGIEDLIICNNIQVISFVILIQYLQQGLYFYFFFKKGQHLLSAIAIREFGMKTLSW